MRDKKLVAPCFRAAKLAHFIPAIKPDTTKIMEINTAKVDCEKAKIIAAKMPAANSGESKILNQLQHSIKNAIILMVLND